MAAAGVKRAGVGSQVLKGLGLFVHDFAGRQVLPCAPCFLDATRGKLSLDVLRITALSFEPGRQPARGVSAA